MTAEELSLLGCLGHIHPLRKGDLDASVSDGIQLHTLRPVSIIGRGLNGVQIQVHHSKVLVGLKHAAILWDHLTSRLVIRCDSTNGVHVNGKRLWVGHTAPLVDGAIIWLGPPHHEDASGITFRTAQNDPIRRNYALERYIGEGSYGVVCQMRSRRTQEAVAVKIVKHGHDAHRVAAALKEVAALERAGDHPNICSVYEHFRNAERGTLYIVMPLFACDLYGIYSDRSPSLSEARDITRQLLDASLHLWKLGIVHRDIKPANVLTNGVLNDTGYVHVVLTDLGMACEVGPDTPVTALGPGTFMYSAPELGDIYSLEDYWKIDVFSIGATIIHLLIGLRYRLWTLLAPDVMSATRRALREFFRYRRLCHEPLDNAMLPDEVVEVLMGLVEPYPSERWTAERALNSAWISEAPNTVDVIMEPQPTVHFAFPTPPSTSKAAIVRSSKKDKLTNSPIIKRRPRVVRGDATKLRMEQERQVVLGRLRPRKAVNYL